MLATFCSIAATEFEIMSPGTKVVAFFLGRGWGKQWFLGGWDSIPPTHSTHPRGASLATRGSTEVKREAIADRVPRSSSVDGGGQQWAGEGMIVSLYSLYCNHFTAQQPVLIDSFLRRSAAPAPRHLSLLLATSQQLLGTRPGSPHPSPPTTPTHPDTTTNTRLPLAVVAQPVRLPDWESLVLPTAHTLIKLLI